FETIPGAAKKVNYPFGFGLSYTEFEIEPVRAGESGGVIRVDVKVTNMGNRSGKEVVQLYYRAPQGLLGKPLEVLGAFGKTDLLVAGQSQILRLELPAADMASYDDLGKIQASAYVLEAGTYSFRVGNSVRNTVKLDYEYRAEENAVLEQLTGKCAPTALRTRLLADGTYEELTPYENGYEKNQLVPQDIETLEGVEPDVQGIAFGEKKSGQMQTGSLWRTQRKERQAWTSSWHSSVTGKWPDCWADRLMQVLQIHLEWGICPHLEFPIL
ncbi:MAG: fibronectin type III-like domain-contianing protein, partial [Blautia marasmi]